MAKDDKTRMTLTIDKGLKHKLTVLAAEQRRDISEQICFMLEASIKPPPRRAMPSTD